MALADLKDFPKKGRLLGVDWGARRTGIAVSDESQGFVFPRGVVSSAEKNGGAVSEILRLIESEKIAGVVLGLPLHADGTDSDTTRAVRAFAAELAGLADLPVAFIEENLTSMEALERQKAKSKKEKARLGPDAEAAAVILENVVSVIKRI
jgi:putative Holliday junction resolvase